MNQRTHTYLPRASTPPPLRRSKKSSKTGIHRSTSKHQIQPEYGDEQVDAGRDCRTRLARPNSQARTRTGNIHFACSTDHEQDWQPNPVDPYSCYMCDYTYIYTYIIPRKLYR